MEPAALTVTVADGVRLHVRHWPGEPGRTPFLLVHGLSSNARLWDGVAALLSAGGHPAYAVDLRSHGGSARPESGYDTAGAAADVAAVATTLGLPPAVVAGHSWGGHVAVAVAAKHPGPVRAIALADGGWVDLRAHFLSWAACESRLRPPALDGIRSADLGRHLRQRHPDWAPWAIDAALASFRTGPDGRLERRLPAAAHLAILRSIWAEPPGPLFASVPVPALLLPAVGPDGAGKRALVAGAAAGFGQATVKEYRGAGHDLHVEQPRRLAADLLMLAART